VTRELGRGCVFIHNRIEDIYRVADKSETLPGASIEVTHGRMRERDPKGDFEFHRRQSDILVTTAIVESGRYSESQHDNNRRCPHVRSRDLYQLREGSGGRRESLRILPRSGTAALTLDARRRLKAISEFRAGSGFKLALSTSR
jgi:transcription-repair coupling factor (superfamily II helicase)